MDNLDHGILDLLRQNARAGYGDIGDRVGLSASAVKRRVDRLVDDGVIRAFTIQVDPKVDGYATEAYVELFCRGTVCMAAQSATGLAGLQVFLFAVTSVIMGLHFKTMVARKPVRAGVRGPKGGAYPVEKEAAMSNA